MAEKNTISILESIKKKMHNFEKPRESKGSGFATSGDEFDYISSNKKDAAAKPQENSVEDSKNNAASANQASNVLEKEMDETFSSFLSKNAEEKTAVNVTNEEIVPPVKAEEKPKEDPQDDFLNSFSSEPEEQAPVVEPANLALEENHEEPIVQAEQNLAAAQMPAQTHLPSNHDDDAAFDFLDDHNLDEHLNAPQEPHKNEPELLAHDELHELNETLGGNPQAVAPSIHDDHDFSFLHDNLHEEVASTATAKTNVNIAGAPSETSSDDIMESFLKSDAPSVEAVAEVHKAPPAQAKIAQEAEFLSQYNKPSQLPPMQNRTRSEAIFQPPLQTIQAQTNANFASQPEHQDDFDEEAFLKADENKLRKEYEEIKASEPKVAFKSNLSEVTQNKRQQVMSAADSLLKGNAFDQTSDSLKKLLEAKNTVSTVASFAKSDNLNEIALQLLEPRLEKWLNENLPALVDKIVREEINKIMPKN